MKRCKDIKNNNKWDAVKTAQRLNLYIPCIEFKNIEAVTPMKIIIFVPTDEIWDSVKREAGKKGKSVSNYLIWLHDVYIHDMGIGYNGEPIKSSYTQKTIEIKKICRENQPG